MSLFSLLIVLLLVGVGLYVLNNGKLPIDGTIRMIINAVVVIAVLLFLADTFLAHDLYVGRPLRR